MSIRVLRRYNAAYGRPTCADGALNNDLVRAQWSVRRRSAQGGMRVYCAGNGPSPALRAFTPPRGFCVAERAAADGRGMRRAMGGSARRGFDGFFISDCTALELMQNVQWDDCKHPWPSEGGSCRCVHV